MRYEAAAWDTHVTGPQPGAVALRDYTHQLGFGDVGIYNDRAVRGATAVPSTHREGRALDLTKGTKTDADVTYLLDELIFHFEPLGVQQIIWQRASWRCDRPLEKWRPYRGVDPHTSHAHIELTWEAAGSLTVQRIHDVLQPLPTPPLKPSGDDDMYFVKDDRADGWSIWHIYRHQDSGLLVRRELRGDTVEWTILKGGYESKVVTVAWADLQQVALAPGL